MMPDGQQNSYTELHFWHVYHDFQFHNFLVKTTLAYLKIKIKCKADIKTNGTCAGDCLVPLGDAVKKKESRKLLTAF